MKRVSTLVFFLIFWMVSIIQVEAQSQPMVFGNGVPIKAFDYTNIVGSPYLFEDWHTGSVALNNGKLFDNVFLKYNIKDDDVYFKSVDESPMAFKDGVKSFTLTGDNNKIHTFQKGYNASGITDESFLEVIASGKAQLLKKDSKSIIDSKEYGSGIVNRRFIQSTKYYIYIGPDDDAGKGKTVMVKKDQKSVLNALKDKEEELTDYIQKKSLNLKNEDDIAKIVAYYGTLIK